MSAETLAIVISAIGTVLSLGVSMFAGGAWIVRRIDTVEQRIGTRIDTVEQRLGARIDTVEQQLGARIDTVERHLGARIDTVDDRLGIRIDDLTGEVTDLKVAVARWEGPPRYLQVKTR